MIGGITGKSLLRPLAFVLYLVSVNLLSGYVALALNYPSLFNVKASFGEYAIPLPFTWALAHWPTMLIFGIPLLYISRARRKLTQNYRLLCAIIAGLLLLTLNEKIPFLLFPWVDALAGLAFSLVLVPPNRKANPVLFPVTCLAVVGVVGAITYIAFDHWQHRTPTLNTTTYADGVFELTSIDVNKKLREMRVVMALKERLEIDESCELGQQVAEQVLQDYPFDTGYNRLVEVWFNPESSDVPENTGRPYRLGEISLNEVDIDPDGSFACYLKYKKIKMGDMTRF
jgi:hypothetical protein